MKLNDSIRGLIHLNYGSSHDILNKLDTLAANEEIVPGYTPLIENGHVAVRRSQPGDFLLGVDGDVWKHGKHYDHRTTPPTGTNFGVRLILVPVQKDVHQLYEGLAKQAEGFYSGLMGELTVRNILSGEFTPPAPFRYRKTCTGQLTFRVPREGEPVLGINGRVYFHRRTPDASLPGEVTNFIVPRFILEVDPTLVEPAPEPKKETIEKFIALCRTGEGTLTSGIFEKKEDAEFYARLLRELGVVPVAIKAISISVDYIEGEGLESL